MRSSKSKVKKLQLGCVVCKRHTCIDEKSPKIKCIINSETHRVTRSVTKLIKAMDDFILIELYKCMPLLGNEKDLVPHWEIHLVHYAVVFKSTP